MNRVFVAAFIGVGVWMALFLGTLLVLGSGSDLLERIYLVLTFIFFLPAAPLGLLSPTASDSVAFPFAWAVWFGLFELRRYIYGRLEARRLTRDRAREGWDEYDAQMGR